MSLVVSVLLAAVLAPPPQVAAVTVRVSGRVGDAATNEPLTAARVVLTPPGCGLHRQRRCGEGNWSR